jgi:GNAT superfamily N-acetyltransferase
MNVRPKEPADHSDVLAFYEKHETAQVARFGQLVHPIECPALLAEARGRLAGILTYIIDGEECEILTLHSAERWRRVGTTLIEAVERLARDRGCRRLWLITTNDNIDALRFYQRRGFRLAALYPGAVGNSRVGLKPEIPEMGEYGIPLRDELELEKAL